MAHYRPFFFLLISRLLYRQRNRREVYETNLTLILLQGRRGADNLSLEASLYPFPALVTECSLTLKASSGWFDSSLLPGQADDCTFRFSSGEQLRDPAPGLLVKLLRLNVPCSSGGFLQFNRTITMCGKLEEFPESQRTLYFHSLANATVKTARRPAFRFAYKLVDHCYNVTLLDRNSSFVIRTTQLALKCHFKIHLPFGNRIKLRLRLGNEADTSVAAINMSRAGDEMRVDYRNLNVDDFSLGTEAATSSSCAGILVEMANRRSEHWSQCTTGKSFAYELTSSDNVLLIRITKQSADSRVKGVERLSLEYSAVPIETVVSQCAFGWILVGQFCMSSFSEPLSWPAAESSCNELGGNLASIRSEAEQQMIDEMVLNR